MSISFNLRVQLATRRIVCWLTFFVIYLSYRVLRLRLWLFKPADETTRKSLWDSCHFKNSRRAYSAILYLEGLWIKAGQYVSTRVDVFPDEYTSLLSVLQDSLPEKSWADTKKTICQELNIQDLDEIFEHVDPVPLATASIAQVHKAKIKTSLMMLSTEYGQSVHEDVVVKVQHTGVDLLVMQDIEDLTWVVWLIGKFEPDYDLRPIVEEWANEVPNELDFCHEADNVITMRREYEAYNQKFSGDQNFAVDCIFAEPCLSLTTKKVFVMEYLPGLKMNDPAVKQGNVDELVLKIMRAYGCSIYFLGFWNADPHLGNFLVINNVPCLLDFGLTKRATDQEVMALCRILIAAYEMDYTSLLSGLQDLQLKFPVDEPERAMNIIRYLFRNTGTREEGRKDYKKFNRDMKDKREEDKEKRANIKKLQKDRYEMKLERESRASSDTTDSDDQVNVQGKRVTDAFPGILVFFGRVLNLLRGLCSTFDAEINYMEVMVPFARLHLARKLTPQVRIGLASFSRPAFSPLEEKLRSTVAGLIASQEVLGVQVCVIQNGRVMADVYGGIQGSFDPKPVRGDTLFPVFSCSKALAAACLHLLIQDGKCSLNDTVVQYWPEFARSLPVSKEKEWKLQTKISDVLNHAAGLASAGNRAISEDVYVVTNWEKMVREMELAVPEHAPGEKTKYHALSFGWLVGHLVERISGMEFALFLNTRILEPSGVNGKNTKYWKSQSVDPRDAVDHECPGDGFMGIPIGLEDRMGIVEMDMERIRKMMMKRSKSGEGSGAPSTEEADFNLSDVINKAGKSTSSIAYMANPGFVNDVRVRRSVIPALSGNFSARGLSSFYSGVMNAFSAPTLETIQNCTAKEFKYGFRQISFGRAITLKQQTNGFGHPGLGGSIGFCVPKDHLAVAITINKLSLIERKAVRKIIDDISSAFKYGPWKDEGIRNDVTVNPFKN